MSQAKYDILQLAKEYPHRVSEEILEAAASGIQPPDIDVSARFGEGVNIGSGVAIREKVEIGDLCTIGDMTVISPETILFNKVDVGSFVTIGRRCLIMSGARICSDMVRSGSSDARQLCDEVSVGQNVRLHEEVELGEGAIVPTQRTIQHLGYFGSKNRVVTIYGSDVGPRFSIGCQIGENFDTIKNNVIASVYTDLDSSRTYLPFLGVFNEIGHKVQKAYDKEDSLIGEMKSIREEKDLVYRD